jgi:hypothetical protein
MKKLIQYRGKESMCRQLAVFDFENRWRWLAEAEMWAHKAQDESAAQRLEAKADAPAGIANAVPAKVAA